MNPWNRRRMLLGGAAASLCVSGFDRAEVGMTTVPRAEAAMAGGGALGDGDDSGDGPSGRIDVHHHYTAPTWLSWAEEHGLANRARLPWWAKWDLDSTMSMMDSLDIATSVFSPALFVESYQDDRQHRESIRIAHQAATDLLEARPGRFAFFVKLPLDHLEMASWALRHGLDELGGLGVSVFTHDAKGRYLGDPVFDGLLAELNERAAVIALHPTDLPGGHPAKPAVPGIPTFVCDFPLDTTRAAINLIHRGTLDRFPNLSIILPHGGGFLPYIATRLEISVPFMAPAFDVGRIRDYLGRFYYDTAGPMSPSATPSLVSAVDPERILYGSDWPAAAFEAISDAGTELDRDRALEPHQRHGISRTNAIRLMPSLAGDRATG